jgi:hypothetical protein
MQSTPFDCLRPADLETARQPATEQEMSADAFNKAFPRELPGGIRHLHYYWRKWQTGRLPLNNYVRAFSAATTNYMPVLRLIHIAKLVCERRPKVVLEFGTGVSTVFFAQLLSQYGGRIVSFEQSRTYYDSVQQAFPDALRDTADIRLEPVRLSWFGSYRGIYFDFEPPAAVDLVYIDGPARTRGNAASDIGYHRVNADLVRMVQAGTKVGYAFSDHRWVNAPFFRDHLPGYEVQCSRWWKSVIIRPKMGHSFR